MRTTIIFDDALLDQARDEAKRRGQTLTALMESSLRHELARATHGTSRQRVELPVFESRGPLMPGVDLNDSAALLDILEPPEEVRAKLEIK